MNTTMLFTWIPAKPYGTAQSRNDAPATGRTKAPATVGKASGAGRQTTHATQTKQG